MRIRYTDWRGGAIEQTARPDGTPAYRARYRVRAYEQRCCPLLVCDCPDEDVVYEVPVLDHEGEPMDR